MRWRAGPSGVHLFDRRTGLNYLFDEVRVPQGRWATAPRQVSIALTNTCDLACAHCYAPKNRAALSVNQVCHWLAELDANGCLGVGFGGGEPTLYQQFSEVCRFAAQQTELSVTFTTHGHHLDEHLAATLAGHVHFVRVSMDGVGDTYEALRGRSFASLRERLFTIGRLAKFGINFVVNRMTLPDLDTATELAAEMGAVEFLLLPEQPVRGRRGIDVVTSAALQDWVQQYRGSVPLTVSVSGADGLPTCNPLEKETGLLAYAHIDATGMIKCSSFDVHGVSIGEESVMSALARLRSFEEGRP